MRRALMPLGFALLFPTLVAGQSTVPLTSIEAERAVRVLVAWLESEDPDAGELAPVLKFGQSILPSLRAALSVGPSPARRERLRRSLESGYERLAEQSRNDADRKIPPRDEYLRYYTANFEALYRVRAAQALAAIGGPEARKALEAALERSARVDVREAIQQCLRDIK